MTSLLSLFLFPDVDFSVPKEISHLNSFNEFSNVIPGCSNQNSLVSSVLLVFNVNVNVGAGLK